MCIDVFGEGWGTFKIAHLSTGARIGFELSEKDVGKINGLDQHKRIGPDPDNFDF